MFAMSFHDGMASVLGSYVTSSFGQNPLTELSGVISQLAAGLVKLPFAKLIDIWGRPQGFALMVISSTIGYIMMAGCNSVATYLVAQLFYQIGYTGVQFCIMIFIADTCSLRNRAFVLAFSSSPDIATAYAAGPAASRAYHNGIGWRWCYGMWAVIVPILCAPLFGLFYHHDKLAEHRGLVAKDSHECRRRTWYQLILYYLTEFDVIGLLLLSAGLALFLLTFSLYAHQPHKWRQPFIIAFFVAGGLLVIAFAIYERFFAPVTFFPWALMKNRTVIFTYTMVAALYTPFSIWDSQYFRQLLQTTFDLTMTQTTYMSSIYTVGACVWSIVFGLILRYNGRSKWHAVLFAVPITILGVGLQIHFRQPHTDPGYIAMCLVFVAVGGGTLVICEQVNVMAATPHNYVAAILSLEGMISYIGQAVGSSICSAIWIGIFPGRLRKFLPLGAPLSEIYSSLPKQISYPMGSPVREGVNLAYSETQRIMLITAVCMYLITWVSVMLWEDVDLKNMRKQQDRVI